LKTRQLSTLAFGSIRQSLPTQPLRSLFWAFQPMLGSRPKLLREWQINFQMGENSWRFSPEAALRVEQQCISDMHGSIGDIVGFITAP
jgi:hypothetical protein